MAEFEGDIFEYRAGLAIEFNDWIPGLDTARGGRLVTINHDDDDLLPEDYLAGLAQLIDAATADGTLPPVSLAASSQILPMGSVAHTAPTLWKHRTLAEKPGEMRFHRV